MIGQHPHHRHPHHLLLHPPKQTNMGRQDAFLQILALLLLSLLFFRLFAAFIVNSMLLLSISHLLGDHGLHLRRISNCLCSKNSHQVRYSNFGRIGRQETKTNLVLFLFQRLHSVLSAKFLAFLSSQSRVGWCSVTMRVIVHMQSITYLGCQHHGLIARCLVHHIVPQRHGMLNVL